MAVDRSSRNIQLLSQISEKNPFKTLAKSLLVDIPGAYAKDMEDAAAKLASGDITIKGKREAAQKRLREALRAGQDRLKPFKEYIAQIEAMKARVKLPDYDKSSYAARLRAEIRDRSYDLTPQQRMGLLASSSAFFDAVSEQEPWLSGLREKSELDALAAAKTARLAELHGPLQAAIAERESNKSEIEMIDNMHRLDLASDSGLAQREFEAEAKAIESKASATEAPKAPTANGQDATPSPEIEAIWKRFDELVSGSAA
jgi:hypothetical protein